MTESRFELKTFGSDTILNYHLSQKLKLIGIGKFNHLINTLNCLFWLLRAVWIMLMVWWASWVVGFSR